MYKHLLVPLDASPLATVLIERAVAYAQATAARVLMNSIMILRLVDLQRDGYSTHYLLFDIRFNQAHRFIKLLLQGLMLRIITAFMAE